jgi:hypothetical protein
MKAYGMLRYTFSHIAVYDSVSWFWTETVGYQIRRQASCKYRCFNVVHTVWTVELNYYFLIRSIVYQIVSHCVNHTHRRAYVISVVVTYCDKGCRF